MASTEYDLLDQWDIKHDAEAGLIDGALAMDTASPPAAASESAVVVG